MKRLLTVLSLLAMTLAVAAQTVVSGVVTDRRTGRPLSHVNIYVGVATADSVSGGSAAESGSVHTVTNDDGRFTLKSGQRPQYVQLTHIGYRTLRHPLGDGPTEGLKLAMTASSVELEEVIVSAGDALAIVKAAMRSIEKNYPGEPELARCFYRETARRGSRFISVAEAVVDMYKSSYRFGPGHDVVAILKGRRLMSMKASDTLGVKIQGGPVMPLVVDVAKNPDYMLNMEQLALCGLHTETPVRIGDRLQYVVSVTPRADTPYPMMGGRLYIDQQTLAFTRAELQLDMSDWRKASAYMLVHKPQGLRFRPKELSVTVVYETDEKGVTRMSYARNVMRFNCDWRRRLFASSFTTVCEMVVTERLQKGSDAKPPRGRSTFGIKERFYDRVEYFDDPAFWADYNIIEPTESLEHAIDKLKKNVSK